MLDPVEFGKSMASIVRDATAPLLKRIEQLEARQPERGERGERGLDAPSVTDEQIHVQVSNYLKSNPVERGEKGESGEKGDRGNDGKDADPVDVKAIIRGLIESDDLLSLVELRVKEEFATVPMPKDGKDGKDGRDGDKGERGLKGDPGEKGADGIGLAGAMIDRDHNLIVTLTNGETKSLGRVVGKDGDPGKDGADFSEVRFEYDGERTLKVIGKVGDISYRLPIPIDRGYWRSGMNAEQADIVTEGGTAYIALVDTKEKPSLSSADWRILARKGRDGKDGRNGIDKTAPVKVDA